MFWLLLLSFLTTKPKSEPRWTLRVELMQTLISYAWLYSQTTLLWRSQHRNLSVDKSNHITLLRKIFPFLPVSLKWLIMSVVVCPLLTTTASLLFFDLNFSYNKCHLTAQTIHPLSQLPPFPQVVLTSWNSFFFFLPLWLLQTPHQFFKLTHFPKEAHQFLPA